MHFFVSFGSFYFPNKDVNVSFFDSFYASCIFVALFYELLNFERKVVWERANSDVVVLSVNYDEFSLRFE